MKETPLISVVVPAYNMEKYIAQCIDNLIYQSYKHTEILIVDDGSTDDTARIVNQYPRVKYIHQSNSGVSAARNMGIAAAQGEYIHFMDADDLLDLRFYEKMVQAAVDTDSDMACSGFFYERYPAKSQKIEHRFLTSCSEDKARMTNVANYSACWRYIFKRSFLEKNQLLFEVGRMASEDRMFSIQAIYFANRIVSVPEVVYYYKNRKNSASTTKKLGQVKKRHGDRKHAKQFQAKFIQERQFSLDYTLDQHRWQYKLFGVPILSKRVYHPGKINWYFLNIPVFQKKEIDL